MQNSGVIWFNSLFFSSLCLLFSASLFAQVELSSGSEQDALVQQRALDDSRNYYVLLLNSYNKGYAWTDNEVQAIEESFEDERQVLLSIEYMDTKMANTPQYLAQWKELFAQKFININFDLIIATDDDALKFLRKYRSTLFPDVPVVFTGVNNFDPSKIAGFSNVTGVNEQADFHSNIELILKLHPGVKHVYVISDQLTAGQLIRQEFTATAQQFNDRVEFHYLADLTIDDLISKVSKLTDNSIIFYLSFFRDASNKSFSPWEAIPLISRNASVPLYGQVDYMLGKGITGGRVKSSYYQGKEAAKLAQRILYGEAADDIPVVMESPNYYMFDYDQLQRFAIPVKSLPKGSIIINEPQSFYFRYKKLIWTFTGVVTFLVIFILVLLFNIRHRKRAQRGLQHIIDAMGSFFQHSSVETMRDDLINTIGQVIFREKHIEKVEFFHYSGNHKSFDPEHLLSYSRNKSVTDELPIKLIRKSIENNRCAVKQNECVALFKTRAIPANVIYFKAKRKFDKMDRNLLEILTNNFSMAIDSFDNTKTIESLETARKIQLSMLPHDFSNVKKPFGIDIHAHLVAAKEVGGDFYDVFMLDVDHLCLVVGDVSDKGVPAALFMAMAKTLIRSYAELGLEPDKILSRVNDRLIRDNDECMFVTLFFAIFDRCTGSFRFANGGHNPPCQISANGAVSWLPLKPGIALGLTEHADYTLQSITLDQGDSLFVYTDGVTEAMNEEAEQFGEDRLLAFLRENAKLEAEILNDKIIREVGHFAGGAQQSDDITVLFIRIEQKT